MINLQFSYDEADYISALRAYIVRKPRAIALFVFTYLVSLALLRIMLSGGISFDVTLFLMCAAVLLFALFALLFFVFPHSRYQHSYKAVDKYQLQVNERGIFYETQVESDVLSWRRCTTVIEGKRFYLFEHNHRRITVIPKRAFKDAAEETAFRELVKNNLPPALSSRLLRTKKTPEPEDQLPPQDKMPDWR